MPVFYRKLNTSGPSSREESGSQFSISSSPAACPFALSPERKERVTHSSLKRHCIWHDKREHCAYILSWILSKPQTLNTEAKLCVMNPYFDRQSLLCKNGEHYHFIFSSAIYSVTASPEERDKNGRDKSGRDKSAWDKWRMYQEICYVRIGFKAIAFRPFLCLSIYRNPAFLFVLQKGQSPVHSQILGKTVRTKTLRKRMTPRILGEAVREAVEWNRCVISCSIEGNFPFVLPVCFFTIVATIMLM